MRYSAIGLALMYACAALALTLMACPKSRVRRDPQPHEVIELKTWSIHSFVLYTFACTTPAGRTQQRSTATVASVVAWSAQLQSGWSLPRFAQSQVEKWHTSSA